MNFELSEEHRLFREMVRDFAEQEIRPIAPEIDKSSRFPKESIAKMAELGLLGINIPEQYSGAGMDELGLILAIEEIARVCSATAVTMAVHHSVCQSPILHFGTDLQKERFLNPLASGQCLGAFALTEPNAGSDAASIRTRAVRDGEQWVLNGTKTFITNGGVAGIVLVAAVTGQRNGRNNIGLFIVEKDRPGFSVGKKEDKMGIRGSDTSELVFDDCVVPHENMLGKEEQGFKIIMQTLSASRIGVAAQAVGIARGALECALKYTAQRTQFSKPLNSFQALQTMLADMATEIDAAALLTYRACALNMKGANIAKEASMAKLFASEMVQRVVYKALQMHGGYGYVKEYDIERYYRDARVTTIYEGTSEIQRLIIARALTDR